MSDPIPATTADTPSAAQLRQRRAIGWGAGLFLGLGIGGALALGLQNPLAGLLTAVVITVVVAGAYLTAGYAWAERRAEAIVARQEREEEEIAADEDDDGTY